MQATLLLNGFQKHKTNTRIYVAKALNTTWHIRKEGRGSRRTHTHTLTKSTTRFVATEQASRPRVLSKPTLHELIAALKAAELLQHAQAHAFD